MRKTRSLLKTKNLSFIIIILAISILLTGCKREGEVVDNSEKTGDNSGSMTNNIQKTEADKYCEGKTGQKACPAKGEEVAKLETNYGTITIKLFPDKAPKTVANFKKLIGEGFYDDLIFHRVIEGFMVQGGDPSGDGTGGPDYTIDAEIATGLSHIAGAIATARLGDEVNPEKASSGSQFYIVHDDTGAKGLDDEYTIFGQVVLGQNIVEKIAQAETDSSDKPLQDVIIKKAYLVKY
ncbi:MAG: peptidyl-prolyl cis-trans isomerase cyclophilin-type [candidate division WS6 bacterium GW2011_GWA2_37_6]|uniref:Peptidyl-prolyl cis-trans isomerase n=1 Tax=candidate division WS6 bacterium GW2011_GWA2_37_6 TaxID=1619087 RepID=A0A0G0JFH1_9BACT|nr:MAG: peptidyl-prolyl cis-trans isomerase cyclophilin-type [candidate division WS6 bacterium GW2011_GWA2_37_6]